MKRIKNDRQITYRKRKLKGKKITILYMKKNSINNEIINANLLLSYYTD